MDKEEGVGMMTGKVGLEGVDTERDVVTQRGSGMDGGEVAEILHACWSSGVGLEQVDGGGVIDGGLDEYKNDSPNAHLTQLAELVEKNREVAVRNIRCA